MWMEPLGTRGFVCVWGCFWLLGCVLSADSLFLHRWLCLAYQWCIDGDVAFINRIDYLGIEFCSG